MDNRILRVLNLEREVFRLSEELVRLEHQFQRGRTFLGTVGTTGGQPPVIPPPAPPPPDNPPPPPDGGEDLPPNNPPIPTCCSTWGEQAPVSYTLSDSVHPGTVTLDLNVTTGLYRNSPMLTDSRFPSYYYNYLLGCPDNYSVYTLVIAIYYGNINDPLPTILSATYNGAGDCAVNSFIFNVPPDPSLFSYPNGGTITVS